MCGAGGYANFTKQMLVSLGWDKSKIYNVGGYWNYEGKNAISTKIDGSDKCDFSKVLYHNIDFDSEMKRIQKDFKVLLKDEKDSQTQLLNAFKTLGYEL